MFSVAEKIEISKKIEKILLDYDHPEMPKERPEFHLKVVGKESWSWAEIDPNWYFENKEPGMNPFNEKSRESHDAGK